MKSLLLTIFFLTFITLTPKEVFALNCPGGVERINPITNVPYCDGTTDPSISPGVPRSSNDALGTVSFPAGFSLDASSILNNLVGVFIAVGGLIFFFMLLFGGIRFMTAGGDPKNAESARKTITNAVVGLVIVVSAYLITSVLGELLGIPFLNPTIPGL